MIHARCPMTSSLTTFWVRISPQSRVSWSLESITTSMVLTCCSRARRTMTRWEAWMPHSLPYCRSRAVVNWIMSRSIAPWTEAMSMTGAASPLFLAAASWEAWWCRWYSRNHARKFIILGRSNSRSRPLWFSAFAPWPRVERSTLISMLNDVCTNSSKNFFRPARTASPTLLALSRLFRMCGFRALWSLTDPSSRSTKKGSWNALRFLSFRASGSRNSRSQRRPPLLTCSVSPTEVEMWTAPEVEFVLIRTVPKRLWREGPFTFTTDLRMSSCWRRSFRTDLSFSLLPCMSSSGLTWVQMW
mmetsp:Transcript_68643/g.201477  ORF Transcript_68643/g.201477 Transcript_68643/m.201477 type:complete len:301 (+) Transcript_68643:1839-2741(+)